MPNEVTPKTPTAIPCSICPTADQCAQRGCLAELNKQSRDTAPKTPRRMKGNAVCCQEELRCVPTCLHKDEAEDGSVGSLVQIMFREPLDQAEEQIRELRRSLERERAAISERNSQIVSLQYDRLRLRKALEQAAQLLEHIEVRADSSAPSAIGFSESEFRSIAVRSANGARDARTALRGDAQ